MVGQNLAAGEFRRVKSILGNLAAITLSVASVFSVIFVMFPQQVFSIFTSDPSVLSIADRYVPIAVLLFFGSAMRAIMNALLNGSGNYRINFVTAILDGVIMRIGLATLFGIVLSMNHYGFWLGDAIAGFTPFMIGIVYYVSGKWRKDAVKNKQ